MLKSKKPRKAKKKSCQSTNPFWIDAKHDEVGEVVQEFELELISTSTRFIVHLLSDVVPGKFLRLHGCPEPALNDLVVGTDRHAREINFPTLM